MVTVGWDTSNLKVLYSGGKVCTACCGGTCPPLPDTICMEVGQSACGEDIVLCGQGTYCESSYDPSQTYSDPNQTLTIGLDHETASSKFWVGDAGGDWYYWIRAEKSNCRITLTITHKTSPVECYQNLNITWGECAPNIYDVNDCGTGNCEDEPGIVGYDGYVKIGPEGSCP